MPQVVLYNMNGEQVGEVELNKDVFGPINRFVLHDAVVKHLAGRRRGTHDTKTRAEVRGGGRKPWRQKGTGRARHGSIRSPIWRGGGIVFGPHPRDYSYPLPKKVRRLALKSALSAKAAEGKILVLDELKLAAPRTKEMLAILDNLGITGPVLLVTAARDENTFKSARNLPGVKTVAVEGLNTYDILASDTLLLTRDALARVEEVFSR
ncbi:MAG: 50S ribosomal protein L4 [Bacillota bacterium]